MTSKKVEKYDATRYNYFDNTKYRRSHGYDDIVTYEIKGETKVLPKAVVKLLELIFDKASIDNFYKKYAKSPDNSSDPLTGITKVLTGILMPWTIIPSILNDLFFMEDARTIMKECENDPNAIYMYYTKLNTKIRPLEKTCSEYKKISEYFTNSQGPTHKSCKLELMEVFKIMRYNEFKKYKHFRENLKHKKLLWHGSRLGNFASILRKGLQIAPNHVQRTGSMFGEGIYFADIITKSANYCHADSSNPIGLLLLAEVAIGNTYKLTKSNNVTKLPADKHSVKAYGEYQPDRNGNIYTTNGIQVPMGRPIRVNKDADLKYNEYIIYNPEQILMQYLVQVKFN